MSITADAHRPAETIDAAFKAVPRDEFLPPDQRINSSWDAPLPIGYGQTNSQPYTVALMLEWLEVQAGDKILDIGSGSGWTSALLAQLTGGGGRVYAVEKVPELVEFGAENCRKLGIRNIRFYKAGKTLGLPKFAPYDRILVSAAASQLPSELLRQLKIDGRMVIPIRNSIFVIDKTGQETYEQLEKPGFAFVPLVK